MALLEDANHAQDVRSVFREMLRENDSLLRKEKRDAEHAGRRGISLGKFGGTKPSLADVEAAALQLKKKAGGSENRLNDLNLLQAAFSFPGEGFGEAFVKIDGALPALVRDLSGQDSSLQLKSTYCCANLALAGPDIGLKVAKAAAPYLMTHLQGMNQILLEASLWAVGSLSGTGIPALKVLEVQGIFPQIIAIMQRYHPPTCSTTPLQESSQTKLQEIRVIEAVLYAATLCVSAGLPDNIKSSDIEGLAAAAVPLLDRSNSIFLARLMYLYFVLSCSESSEEILLNYNVVNKIILLLDEIRVVTSPGSTECSNYGFLIQVLTYIIRTLGNLCSGERGRSTFESMSEIISPILNNVLKALPYLPMHLLKETLWFIMQLLKPYAQWSDGVLQVCQCPWTVLAAPVNSSLKLQSNRFNLGATLISEGTDS
ncbi:uncharacterized protein LOC124163283 [Ischnura elegans]|uniref:uncharacterized protein LOC124163283 n=1 Tax=Ischnura elegans TaxID=197161 RepID=UPI001ED890D5|nr:uncharacterized protein LOC124163283 [Ischnura elegans]XP_046396047.1 uncharacterized protein LOC124163283 [Ischnura elegans]XP_046396056.1 uncharacterized protein LOC124163283 [Ischnura elegans]XP_046396066.1 uncharacterized protein LOC124163283 [Ischnura elegans]